MRLPRLLTRKLYRAFPELDIYSDEQCRRFVAAASHGVSTLVRYAACTAAALIGLAASMAAIAAIMSWHDNYLNRLRKDDALLTTAAYAVSALLIPIGPFAALLARDLLLQRRVRWVLRSRSSCPACRYRLIGLPLTTATTITCPECGHIAEVDPSLGELTLDEHGREQYIPSIKVPVRRFWTRQRVLRSLKITAAAIGIPLLLAGGYEGFLRWQAHRAAALINQFTAQRAANLAALHPNTPGVTETGATVLADVAAITAEYDQLAPDKLPTTSSGTPVYPDPSVVLPGTLTGVDPDYTDVAMQLARTVVAKYDQLGAFRRLDDLAACDRMANPLVPDPLFQYIGRARTYGLYNTLRLAMARERQDWPQYARAFETNLALIRLLRTQAQGMTDIYAAYLAAAHLHELRQLLASDPPADLLETLAAAEYRQSIDVPLAVVLESERLRAKIEVATIFTNPAHVRFGKRSLEEWEFTSTQPGIGSKRLGTLSANLDAIDALAVRGLAASKLPAAARNPAFANPTGLLLIDYGYLTPDRIIEWHEAADLHLATARLSRALEHFRVLNVRYPATLSELAPRFLPALPIEPFSRAPFGYRPAPADPRGYLLYSIGPDAADNLGQGRTFDPATQPRTGMPGFPDFPLAKPGEDIVLNAPLSTGQPTKP